MKFYCSQLLALCAGTSAFSVAPKAFNKKTSVATGLRAEPNVPGPISAGGPSAGIWDMRSIGSSVRVEGGTLRTWEFLDTSRENVQVFLTTNGRPLEANIELWIGPDWTPDKLTVYSEDGTMYPIQTLVGTRKKANTISIRNTNQMEYPLDAASVYASPPLSDVPTKIPEMGESRLIQGGAIYATPFPADVEQVQVLMNTVGKQLNAKIELLNGPNNIKQTYEIFTNNGLANSFYVVLECPGAGNVVRIINQAPVEFPCKVWISEV